MKNGKKILSVLLAVLMFMSLVPMGANAATTINYAPNPKVEYNYSSDVTVGTIRYISQTKGATHFNSKYWGSWEGIAGGECCTASISMALSYVGVNKTPQNILDTNFETQIGGWGVPYYSISSISEGINNYINGNGKYSPLLIHFTKGYDPKYGHWVILIGKVSESSYLVLDPGASNTWILTTSDYRYASIDRRYQYYNPNASINNLIKDQLPCHFNIKVTETGKNIMRLPCSKSTDANSTIVESAPKGTTYEAIELVKNSQDNLWYKVKAKKGGTGYIFAGNTTTDASQMRVDDITHSGITVPTNHTPGKPYVLTGSVNSLYNNLINVSVYIYPGNKDAGTAETGASAYINGKSYSFGGSIIDNKTEFNKLSTGTHTFVVGASCLSYFATSGNTYQECTMTLTKLYKASFNVGSGSATHTHSYTSTITTNPTCKTDGIRTYKCSCGDSYTQNIGKHPATHEGGTEIRNARAATCKDTGYTGDTYCKGCGVCIGFGTSTAKNKNNHTGGTTIKNTKNPTCTAEGYTGDTYCKGCNTKLSSGKSIAKIPHAYEEIARIYPDCIKTGLITYACYCGASYDEVIPANGHTETDWIIHKAATCTAAGTKYKECTVCGELLAIEVIPVLPHNYDSVVTKETCTTDGYTTYTCPDCGHTYVGDKTKATGHFDSEWIIDIAPTCTAKGYKHIECTVCGETLKTESIAKTPHDYNYVVTDATCETDGYTTVTCPDCGDTYITDEVPAFGHNDENKDTLCDACGLQLTCEHCGRPIHEGQTDEQICIIIMTLKLLMAFLSMVL